MGIGSDVDITDKGFDLDVHEIKEALHFQRIYNPEDHATRDFYERRLLQLVERQKQGEAMLAKKKEEEKTNEGKVLQN